MGGIEQATGADERAADDLCGCCGIPRLHYGLGCPAPMCRRCVLCHMCRGRHGDAFENDVIAAWQAKMIPTWQAIAAMLVDDGHYTGALKIEPGGCACGKPTCTKPGYRVIRPVKRWEVVVARAIARNTIPDLAHLVSMTLAPHMGGPNLPHVRAAIERDLCEALSAVDPDVVGIEVACAPSVIAVDEIAINIVKRTATMPAMIDTAPDVPVPLDIFSRPRGSA